MSIYNMTKIARALSLAERRVCMRVMCCDVKMSCFSRANHASTNLKKVFELKNSSSWLYLPISSSAETWKILQKCSVNFFCAWAEILSEKTPYFGQVAFWCNVYKGILSCWKAAEKRYRIFVNISPSRRFAPFRYCPISLVKLPFLRAF